jgi:cobyrinic acid a,c-diamide synthase
MLSAMLIAGTHSGVGKTTITLGLIRAFRRRGLVVQPFKVGPDFIDPLHHDHAAGRRSRNLDGWMLEPEVNRRRFAAATADADVAVIEGVMGLFDGSEGKSDRGSSAEMARLLGVPVVLVVDASAMARSAAALIHGFARFDPALNIAGVILNNVGGSIHADMIRDAVGESVPIVGALPRKSDLIVPERHLGLHLPNEAREGYIDEIANLIEASVDLERLLETQVTRLAPPGPAVQVLKRTRARVGIARDEAFCFYYADNLELLMAAGAELVEFSPIRDPLPEKVDGLYFGGGYPELHAEELAANTVTTVAVREFAATGGPIYAECGGLMYLARALRVQGSDYPLCGILPFGTTMEAPLKLAYVEVETQGGLFGPGRSARGHVFHHSEIVGSERPSRCYTVRTNRGEVGDEGYSQGGVLASYVHLHFASEPALASAFVDRCEAFS